MIQFVSVLPTHPTGTETSVMDNIFLLDIETTHTPYGDGNKSSNSGSSKSMKQLTPPTGTETPRLCCMFLPERPKQLTPLTGTETIKQGSILCISQKQLTPLTGTETSILPEPFLQSQRNNSHPYGDGKGHKKARTMCGQKTYAFSENQIGSPQLCIYNQAGRKPR